jgi:hypothetical protein
VLGVGEETGFVQAGPIAGRHDHVIRLPDVHVPRPSATDIVALQRGTRELFERTDLFLNMSD